MTTEIARPHCQATIAKLLMAKLPVDGESRHKAILFCRPLCSGVISSQFDPVSVVAESRHYLLDELKPLLTKQA